MELLRRDSQAWLFLNKELRRLIVDGENILEITQNYQALFSDYSFVVFPFAKAYEGFLKDMLFKMKLISEKEYFGSRFRIGKALNPDLEHRYRNAQSVFDRISKYYGNRDLAYELWDVWKKGRNLLFHYFPHNYQAKSLVEAKEIIMSILVVMEKAMGRGGVSNVSNSVTQ